MPERRFDPLPVRVVVRSSDVVEKDRTIDYNNFNQRQWLQSLLVWAFFHARRVELSRSDEALTKN